MAETGPVRGRPRVTISRSAQTPRQPSTLTARADRPRTPARCSNAVALLGRQQVAGVVLDRLDDPERGQELEVEPDAHEPAGIGQVAALVDDVADQRARVELGLVGADQQDREPRVVGVREARRLARGVGLDQPLDDPLVERAHLRDVVDLEPSLVAAPRSRRRGSAARRASSAARTASRTSSRRGGRAARRRRSGRRRARSRAGCRPRRRRSARRVQPLTHELAPGAAARPPSSR